MRIAFVSPWDVEDPRAWSGVVCKMFEALREQANVVPVFTGDIRPTLVDRALTRALDGRSGKRYLYAHAVTTSIKRGRVVRRRLATAGVDVILDVVASQDVAFLPGSTPIVHMSDTTFRSLRDYYPAFSDLQWISALQGSVIARRTLRRAARCVAASAWAKQAMIREKADAQRITVVPFGPALAPASHHRRERAATDELRLLTVTSDWTRKGGDLALAAFEELRARGRDVSLTVVGDTPALPEGVAAAGPVSATRMAQIYEGHDVLLELARANTGGVTLTDAAAFGLPVVATDTGGVGAIVQDGVTGHLVDPGRDVVTQAVEAIGSLESPSTYEEMSASARARYEQTLNWHEWARKVTRACDEAMRAA